MVKVLDKIKKVTHINVAKVIKEERYFFNCPYCRRDILFADSMVALEESQKTGVQCACGKNLRISNVPAQTRSCVF